MSGQCPPRAVKLRPTRKPAVANPVAASPIPRARSGRRSMTTALTRRTAPMTASPTPAPSGLYGAPRPATRPDRCSAEATASVAVTAVSTAATRRTFLVPAGRVVVVIPPASARAARLSSDRGRHPGYSRESTGAGPGASAGGIPGPLGYPLQPHRLPPVGSHQLFDGQPGDVGQIVKVGVRTGAPLRPQEDVRPEFLVVERPVAVPVDQLLQVTGPAGDQPPLAVERRPVRVDRRGVGNRRIQFAAVPDHRTAQIAQLGLSTGNGAAERWCCRVSSPERHVIQFIGA